MAKLKLENKPLTYKSKKAKQVESSWHAIPIERQKELLFLARYPYFVNRIYDVSLEAMEACVKIQEDTK